MIARLPRLLPLALLVPLTLLGRWTLLGSLALLASGCSAGPAPADDRADFVFTFIRTGPTPAADLGRERSNELFAGHFANMTTMAEAGQLLLAGPFGKPPVTPDFRGIFVFDSTDLATGHGWAETDPPSQAGLFRLESYRWHADAGVREVPARDQAMLAALSEEERANPGATARSYVLCLAADAAAIEPRLAPFRAAGELGLFGVLGEGTDGAPDRTGQALFILVADTPEAARTRAAELGAELDGVEIHPWFASKAVQQLARDGARGLPADASTL